MKLEDIKTICCLGSGTMGLGTALSIALAGYEDIRLFIQQKIVDGVPEDIEKKIENRMGGLAKNLQAFVENGLILADEVPVILARIKPTSSLEEAATGAHLVMESIDEILVTKQIALSRLKPYCPHAIVASNTSGISPTDIANGLPLCMANNVVVAHHFTPAELIPLVEVIPGAITCENKVEVIRAFLEKIGKTPILLKRTYPGFVVNAIQFPILAAACDLVTSRIATAETVDQAVREGLKLSEMDIASALRGYMEEQKKLAMPTGRFKAFMAKTMRQITKSLHDEAALSDDKLSAHIVDTIKLAMLNAASLIVEAGITTPEVIEIALKSSIALRLPQTGPLESADLGGLDTFHDIFSKTLLMPVPKLILDALAKGHIGLKKECMNGIYAWTAEKAAEVRARRTAALFDHVKSQSGAAQTAPIRPAHTTEELLPAAAGIEMPSEMAIA